MNFSVAKKGLEKGLKSVSKRGLKISLKGSHKKVASCYVAVSSRVFLAESRFSGR